MKERKGFFKKILATFAALAMVFGIVSGSAVSVRAEEVSGLTEGTENSDKTITINAPSDLPANSTVTYNVYKVFDATRSSDGSAVNYTVPSGGVNLPITYNNGLEKIDKDTSENVHFYTRTSSTSEDWTIKTDITGDTKLSAEMVNAIKTALNGKTPIGAITITGTEKKKTVKVPDYGYYYITTTTGSLVSIDTTHPSAKMDDKNILPSVDKSEDNATNDIGRTVHYTVSVKLYEGASSVVFHDTLSQGLTLSAGTTASPIYPSVKVGSSALTKDTDYTINHFSATPSTETANSGDNITITFASSYLNSIKGSKDNPTIVTIEYDAVVNSNAVINENNAASVTYGNGATYETTPEKKVYESTFKFKVNKTDSQTTPQPLSGAKFVLGRTYQNVNLTEDNVDSQATSLGLIKFDNGTLSTTGSFIQTGSGTNSNEFTFNGLDADANGTTYYLYEVTAPSGFNKLTEPIDVKMTPTMDPTDSTKVASYTLQWKLHTATDWNTAEGNNLTDIRSFNVPNTKGTLLPSTGGIGTTIFYIAGGILIIGAAVLLIARRKRNA